MLSSTTAAEAVSVGVVVEVEGSFLQEKNAGNSSSGRRYFFIKFNFFNLDVTEDSSFSSCFECQFFFCGTPNVFLVELVIVKSVVVKKQELEVLTGQVVALKN